MLRRKFKFTQIKNTENDMIMGSDMIIIKLPFALPVENDFIVFLGLLGTTLAEKMRHRIFRPLGPPPEGV